jgi:hypothetical protein
MASEGSGLLLVFLSDSNKSGLSHEKVRIIRSVMAVLQSEIKKIYDARSEFVMGSCGQFLSKEIKRLD